MSEESKSWYRMTRPLFNSGFEDDEFWAYGQDGFRELLDSFIARTVQIYDKRMYTEPTSVRAIVQNVTSDAISGTTLRYSASVSCKCCKPRYTALYRIAMSCTTWLGGMRWPLS